MIGNVKGALGWSDDLLKVIRGIPTGLEERERETERDRDRES